MEGDPTTDKTPSRKVNPRRKLYRQTLIGLIVLFFLFWMVLPHFLPGMRPLFYTVTLPFRHLGIFVHEMGHGLFTLLSGGSFYYFQMELMEGGVAVTSGGWRIATLLGGLLGPALAGALLLQASTRSDKLHWWLWGLAFFFTVGVYYMVKPLWLNPEGWGIGDLVAVVVPLGGGLITVFMLRFQDMVQRLYVQLLGILMCYSGYSDTAYIFRFEQLPNGLYSDARVVASLFWTSPAAVPYPLFAVTAVGITVINFALMAWGARRAFRD